MIVDSDSDSDTSSSNEDNVLREALQQAIDANNFVELSEILHDAETKRKTPIDVNDFVIYYESKMLHCAAEAGAVDVVLYLLETLHADVDVREDVGGCTPLFFAANWGRLQVFKCLLEHGANIHATNAYGATAVHYAAQYNYPEIIHFVLDYNNDNNNDNKNKLDLSAIIHAQDGDGCTPFLVACHCSSSSIVKRMFESGANLHCQTSQGRTALHLAACNGDHPQVMDFLLNSAELDVNAMDKNWKTPLHFAVSVPLARLLVDHGAHVDFRSEDNSDISESNIIEGLSLEQVNNRSDVIDFLRLVQTFRASRLRWSLLLGLDHNDDVEESGGTSSSIRRMPSLLFPKVIHLLLRRIPLHIGSGRRGRQVRKDLASVAFLGLRTNGPKILKCQENDETINFAAGCFVDILIRSIPRCFCYCCRYCKEHVQ